MIVSNVPRLNLLVRDVWRPLLVMFVWDVLVTLVYYAQPDQYTAVQQETLTKASLTLFGTVVALFLGFRSNSAYARWWEGRMLWGLMINASRNVTRAALNFIPDTDARSRMLRESIVLRQACYVHVLRCQLRGTDRDDSARRFLDDDEADRILAHTNSANALLNDMGRRVAAACRAGYIDTIQQTQLEAIFVDIANAQGGMERIKKTPLPMQYRFFPQLFVRLFCLLLPIGIVPILGWATPIGSTLLALMFLAALRIGDDLVDPFANSVHDLPLQAMCTTIEIDLLEALGRPGPPATEVERGVLW